MTFAQGNSVCLNSSCPSISPIRHIFTETLTDMQWLQNTTKITNVDTCAAASWSIALVSRPVSYSQACNGSPYFFKIVFEVLLKMARFWMRSHTSFFQHYTLHTTYAHLPYNKMSITNFTTAHVYDTIICYIRLPCCCFGLCVLNFPAHKYSPSIVQ